MEDIEIEFEQIQLELLYHKYLYYALGLPEISDYEYDMLERRSAKLAQNLGFRADAWIGPNEDEKHHVHWMVGFNRNSPYWEETAKKYGI